MRQTSDKKGTADNKICYRLLKHELCCLPIAVQILGYIDHGSASRKAQEVYLGID
jgi:hypothetical protein